MARRPLEQPSASVLQSEFPWSALQKAELACHPLTSAFHPLRTLVPRRGPGLRPAQAGGKGREQLALAGSWTPACAGAQLWFERLLSVQFGGLWGMSELRSPRFGHFDDGGRRLEFEFQADHHAVRGHATDVDPLGFRGDSDPVGQFLFGPWHVRLVGWRWCDAIAARGVTATADDDVIVGRLLRFAWSWNGQIKLLRHRRSGGLSDGDQG